MALRKATFTLDERSFAILERLSARSGKAKSDIVRDALVLKAEHADRLSAAEQAAALAALERLLAIPPTRTKEEVDVELAGIRESRRTFF
jgi:hypothetical protein